MLVMVLVKVLDEELDEELVMVLVKVLDAELVEELVMVLVMVLVDNKKRRRRKSEPQ